MFYVFPQGNREKNMERVHELALNFLKKNKTFNVGAFVFFLNNMKGLSKTEVKISEEAF